MGQFDSGDSWLRRSLKACPDDLMRQIVEDNRGGPSTYSSPIAPPKGQPREEPTNRSGWVEPPPLRSPEGVNYVDALCDQADAVDRAERLRQLAQTAAVQRAEAAIREEAGKKQRDEAKKGGKG
jgi:hypothetical protein